MTRINFSVHVAKEEDLVRDRINQAASQPQQFVQMFTNDRSVRATVTAEGIGWALAVEGPQFTARGSVEVLHNDPGSTIQVDLDVRARGIFVLASPAIALATSKIQHEATKRTPNRIRKTVNHDYCQIIETESAQLLETLQSGDLASPVAGCGDWTLGDLGVHICEVQAWCTDVVSTRKPSSFAIGIATDQVANRFGQVTADLLQALNGLDPQEPCWNFTAEKQVGEFWFRRQALEIAVHRWDGAAAVENRSAKIDSSLACDVVDEFVHFMIQRVISREAIALQGLEGVLEIQATDGGMGHWAFGVVAGDLRITDGLGVPDVKIQGPAHDLAVMIYGRETNSKLSISGDQSLFERWKPAFGL